MLNWDLQVRVLVDLCRAQRISSVNSRPSGSTNIGLGSELVLVLGRRDICRSQQTWPHAHGDLVDKSAGVGSVGGVPRGALRGEEVGDGGGGAQRGCGGWSVSVHVRLAGEVCARCCCCQVGMHWAAVLKRVGSLRNSWCERGHISLLPTWDSISTSLLWGQHCCLLVLLGEEVNKVSGYPQGKRSGQEVSNERSARASRLAPPFQPQDWHVCSSSPQLCEHTVWEEHCTPTKSKVRISSAMGSTCHTWGTENRAVQVQAGPKSGSAHIYSSAPQGERQWDRPVLVPQSLSCPHARNKLEM